MFAFELHVVGSITQMIAFVVRLRSHFDKSLVSTFININKSEFQRKWCQNSQYMCIRSVREIKSIDEYALVVEEEYTRIGNK